MVNYTLHYIVSPGMPVLGIIPFFHIFYLAITIKCWLNQQVSGRIQTAQMALFLENHFVKYQVVIWSNY